MQRSYVQARANLTLRRGADRDGDGQVSNSEYYLSLYKKINQVHLCREQWRCLVLAYGAIVVRNTGRVTSRVD